ncbi:MAG: hypothetical protein J07HN6_00550 [Halonotius sp. J07HN6]|jgi:hypothetical protein|nr:MAG: hypothetical protein J07HN6_00550 [Halonotius sp. J07HN6]ESS08838.1 MAG: hypothetical protein A07HN63_01435 [uncultured archaeon A07HN63]
MTATAKSVHPDESPDTDAPETDSSQSKEARLADYLRERAEAGDMYFKSKFIADEVGLSAKEIGALIVNLQESVDDLSIERWSYTGATTWRVEQTA